MSLLFACAGTSQREAHSATLQSAIDAGAVDAVSSLLQMRADPNTPLISGYTPLCAAAAQEADWEVAAAYPARPQLAQADVVLRVAAIAERRRDGDVVAQPDILEARDEVLQREVAEEPSAERVPSGNTTTPTDSLHILKTSRSARERLSLSLRSRNTLPPA